MLEVRNVDVNFGGVRALDGFQFSLSIGEICGLIGPNGAGKTTLFDVVSGLRRPTHGSILYDGQDITERSVVWRARHGIRRTFQRVQLINELSVLANVLVGLDSAAGRGGLVGDLLTLPTRRHAHRTNLTKAEAALDRCGIGSLAQLQVGVLPIGLTRLVELARALVAEPRVLLLDEPTSGLNDLETGEFGDVVRRLRDEHEVAVVLVEHDVPFVMELCPRVVVMSEGRVLADGSPLEVQEDAAVRSAYLG
jgi:branched-chain amino acid transport system ATP-binding protein